MSSTTTRKRTSPKPKRRRAKKRRASSGASQPRGSGTPGWGDLSSKKKPPKSKTVREGAALLERISTLQFAVIIAVLAVTCTAYVAHVHATQALYAALQHEQAENQRLHRTQERLKAEFDRATGPTIIYRRAPELGLEEDVTYGPTIAVEND